ncbi:hypothetical protein JTE90_028250 [Oedothorax gibbosus]|uniref:Uncharacterized protein n=1 Tax=Oedothorax gibbosus TaxID=931172 RepID=A0AAV6UT54_9ARAC|nr:hypothetical protein JTE90_028250 [Oedothorax gibbosus]
MRRTKLSVERIVAFCSQTKKEERNKENPPNSRHIRFYKNIHCFVEGSGGDCEGVTEGGVRNNCVTRSRTLTVWEALATTRECCPLPESSSWLQGL